MKVIVHDGIGIWLCARRLHQGSFCWSPAGSGATLALNAEELRALVIGLPWYRLNETATIRVL